MASRSTWRALSRCTLPSPLRLWCSYVFILSHLFSGRAFLALFNRLPANMIQCFQKLVSFFNCPRFDPTTAFIFRILYQLRSSHPTILRLKGVSRLQRQSENYSVPSVRRL
ncbi:hypothetical protein C8R47DRAFT_462240 [Mycena vitilis]|nr:hypothetical protein C8R47DRAFT_462240 [Mycena vitilis]